jgi:hypothetical protein
MDRLRPSYQAKQETSHRLLPTAHQGLEGGGVSLLPTADEVCVVATHGGSIGLYLLNAAEGKTDDEQSKSSTK